MSRVAKNPLQIPSGVDVSINGNTVTIKGAKGFLEYTAHSCVVITREDNLIRFQPSELDFDVNKDALAGTARALVRNMLEGISKGYERRLTLVGVGYKAQVQGNVLNLQLGFSHPIHYNIPTGIVIETPSQTEVVVKGIDKQLVGQVSAQVRAYRPPEPYKGKGVRYNGEVIIQKEGKKK